MATKAQQKAWIELFRDASTPAERCLTAWLFGAKIPVTSAIPLKGYTRNIVSDLFSSPKRRYFPDRAFAGNYGRPRLPVVMMLWIEGHLSRTAATCRTGDPASRAIQ
jgi:hypothetical protein